MFTFGSAVAGELGLGKPVVQERRKPGNVKWLNDKEVVAVECGGQHTLALDRHGRVWSWGVNDQGALGRSTDEDDQHLKQQQQQQKHQNRMDGDSSEEDSDDESELHGNEACIPNLVEILNDDGSVPCVKQVRAYSTVDGGAHSVEGGRWILMSMVSLLRSSLPRTRILPTTTTADATNYYNR